jgi:hypothetical protein
MPNAEIFEKDHMRNPTEGSLKKNMVQGSVEPLETDCGDLFDIWQRSLAWNSAKIPEDISISIWRKERGKGLKYG